MKYIPNYITLFDVIINVIYLISFLDWSLQMRNTINFYILSLCSVTLINLVVTSF